MKIRTSFAVLVAVALAAGCAQTQRLPQPSKSQYRPVNEPTHGQVRYMQAGAPSIEKVYREAGYKQAYEACGGSYRILNEWEDPYYNYFNYACVN